MGWKAHATAGGHSMIGDGWDGDPAVRPGPVDDPDPARRRVAIVTGSRAEFGLLRPVMDAVRDHAGLELAVIAAGAHLISPGETYYEVKKAYAKHLADAVPMQVAGRTGRFEDVEALARGIGRFGRSFQRLRPDWVVVLGDRIEPFAAASAASVGGLAVAHIHGGDRAEGVADEAMRHAITKLAHLHLAATPASAERIIRMGEPPRTVHTVGSPAIDGLEQIPPLPDAEWAELGHPEIVFLLHPVGRTAEHEEHVAAGVLAALGHSGVHVLALHPNHDPGRVGILRAVEAAEGGGVKVRAHLPRDKFVGLLKRLSAKGGVLVGNSSAALIEAAALKCAAVDVGARQGGRERAENVVGSASESPQDVMRAVAIARKLELKALRHPYGDGQSGARIAELLARTDPWEPSLLRKRCAY
jgi:UDP-hydrolysing UDP-N-acetyl-D-glucosamine 2-epimerase